MAWIGPPPRGPFMFGNDRDVWKWMVAGALIGLLVAGIGLWLTR